MSSDILQSELFQTKNTQKTTTSKVTTTEIKKEGSSLFDTLLKEAKQTNISKEHLLNKNDQSKTIPNIAKQHNAKQITNQKDISSSKVEVKSDHSKIKEGEKILTRRVSLFEKMSNEIKPQELSKAEQTDKNKPNIVKVEKIVNEEKNSNELNNKSELLKKENILKSKSEPLIKTEQKQSSLLDKMVGEIAKSNQVNKNILNREEITSSVVLANKEMTNSQNKLDEKHEILENASLSSKVQSVENKKILNNKTSDAKQQLEKIITQEKPIGVLDDQTTKTVEIGESSELRSQVAKNEDDFMVVKISPKINGQLETNTKIKLGINIQHIDENQITKENSVLSSLNDSLSGKIRIHKQNLQIEQNEKIKDSKVPFGANIFLSNQKTNGELLVHQKLHEAKELLNNNEPTTKAIKKSGEILGLNPKNIDITKDETKVSLVSENPKGIESIAAVSDKNQPMILNRMFLNKDIVSDNIEISSALKTNQKIDEKVSEAKIASEDFKRVSNDVNIFVERTLIEAFTTKVIASRQLMGSFMSDMARNMYLNYKPPITAFRINLDPVNLGNISIVMRSNKSENSLSVSLNMSQSGTLETLSENKSLLQNALAKTFGQNETNFSLDFGMQDGNSNQEFEQFKEEQSREENSSQLLKNQQMQDESSIELEEQETIKSYM